MPTPQEPIDSPFGHRSTAAEVAAGIDLAGKNILVTGGYSGLGTETVRALAGAGAHVLVGARRPDAAHKVLDEMAGQISILPLDLSDPASIDTFCEKVAAKWGRIDILIANAAIMASPLMRDARGYEMQFATNHLGHFQMTARLWPLLKAADGARVVILSSVGHRLGGLDLDDPNWEAREYAKWPAYGATKSANALFALQLDALGESHGVRAFAVHPGGIVTPLQRHLTHEEQVAMGWFDDDGNVHESFKSVEEGAATSVWCAVSPLLDGKGGVYCEDCNIGAMADENTPRGAGVAPHIRDTQLAQDLWTKSEQLTGVSFPG
ncbi:oxidoreductase [Parerythrobacter jejuensis]|uniref:Probable oxidoreductase n=1 Tax=Parerythrobacter jejuensis TaxID=795812 RepID=A0A845AQN6_9SPHN|nr:oxidoreductase [Parerythrobacter jejuensis]MXP31205.1 SDR family NAD(P)-dependent oxidoreductase [Parerythrobacter jejuensis]MXP33965.1 SDR family NAD(P)-dependent oxidoreductase [Parerythrobacter jejuensis]